jgi:hypothetical protein
VVVTTATIVKHEAERAANGQWADRIARVGFFARGVVYAIVGGFAVKYALGDGGGLLDKHEATRQVERQPFGAALVLLLGVGLGCYALWRLSQAAFAPRSRNGERITPFHRIGWAGAGVVWGALAVAAFQTYAHGHASDGTKSWVHWLLASELGRWAVVGVGVCVIGVGLKHLYDALTARFVRELELERLSYDARRWVIRSGRFGISAHGIVLGIVGGFLVRAGLHANAKDVKGTKGALVEMLQQPYGRWLLGFVAAGLIAYGIYSAVAARWGRAFT